LRIDTTGARAPDWTFDQALRPVSHILRHGIEPPWRALTDSEHAALLRLIDPVDGRYATSAQSHAAFCMLPWYEDAPLVRVVDPAWGDASIYFLVVNEHLYRLNGTSPAIHEVNEIAPLQLTPEHVLEYLRFFCFFVRGEEGPFFLLERADHPILTSQPDEETEQLLFRLASPATCQGQDVDGNFLCSAIVFYGNALFEAHFSVHNAGMVEMLDDDPIETGLTVRFTATLGAY